MDRAIRSSTNELESLGTTPAPKPAVVPQVDPQQALRDRYARDEQMLAKALFRWGTAIWLLSMVIGGIWSGFVGALLGGVLGAVVGTIGVVAVVAYKARRLPVTAPAPEQPDALRAAEPAPAPAEPRHPATVER